MMYRFHPQIKKLLELIKKNGEIGKLTSMEANLEVIFLPQFSLRKRKK